MDHRKRLIVLVIMLCLHISMVTPVRAKDSFVEQQKIYTDKGKKDIPYPIIIGFISVPTIMGYVYWRKKQEDL